MKHLKLLLLIAVPALLSACAVNEPKEEAQAEPKAQVRPSTSKGEDKKDSPSKVDESLGEIEAQKSDEMSEFEKKSLEMQEKQLAAQEQARADAKADREAEHELRKAELEAAETRSMGMLAIMWQWMKTINGDANGTGPGNEEDCEATAVGTESAVSEVQAAIDAMEAQLAAQQNETETEDAESADFRNSSGNTIPDADSSEGQIFGPPAPETNEAAAATNANWHPPMSSQAEHQDATSDWHPPMSPITPEATAPASVNENS